MTYHAPTCGETYDARPQPRDLLSNLARLDQRIELARESADENHPQAIASDLARAATLIAALRTEAAAMPIIEDIECGYEGPVDAELRGIRGSRFYTAYWTCPRCGHDRSEDRETGDDD